MFYEHAKDDSVVADRPGDEPKREVRPDKRPDRLDGDLSLRRPTASM
ncbi:MAG: hypothetical protein ACFUZC_04680 [Chthoniobacteraceae bacterium]